MKRVLTILLCGISLFAAAQKIALIEPRSGEGSTEISGMEKAMVRGELRKAIVNHTGFEAFTRADIDQLMKEQDFQRTGNVSEADIHKLGEMSGADYICVSTLNKSADEFYLEAYLINVETGAISNPSSQYGELVNGKLANMLPVCQALAQELLGTNTPIAQAVMTGQSSKSASSASQTSTSTYPTQPSFANTTDEYVDLGLPSGTKWKAENENCGLINHEQAVALYGNSLPTFEQMTELTTYCKWVWLGDGYHITGPNGKAIMLPVSGYRDVYGTKMAPKQGFYWSSSNAEFEAVFANANMSDKEVAKLKSMLNVEEVEAGSFYYLLITSKSNKIEVKGGLLGMAIRLVK